MAKLRIHCVNCGNVWDVNARSDWHENIARTCPKCHRRIDGQTWEKQILPGFAAMMDANREVMKDHIGYDEPPFMVDYLEEN